MSNTKGVSTMDFGLFSPFFNVKLTDFHFPYFLTVNSISKQKFEHIFPCVKLVKLPNTHFYFLVPFVELISENIFLLIHYIKISAHSLT